MGSFYTEVGGQEYKIISNKNEWKFYEHGGKTESGETLSDARHYAKLEDMIDGLFRKSVRTSDFGSLEELKQNIVQIKEEIDRKVSSLFPDGS